MLYGNAFLLNGAAVSDISAGFGATLGSPNSDLLTGILADGSVFIFSGEVSDFFAPGAVSLMSISVPASSNPGTLASGTFTKGLRPGETLTVTGTGKVGDHFAIIGGTLNHHADMQVIGLEVSAGEVNISAGNFDSFSVFTGSVVNLTGGSIGENSRANSGSTVNIFGGNVGDSFVANLGSTVNIFDGTIGDRFKAAPGSTVNISGGTVGESFDAASDSTVNITGGSIGASFQALSGSTVNVFGGSFDTPVANSRSRSMIADMGSTVNVFGSVFFLNGVEVSDLVLGEAFTIADRDVTLSGEFADGTEFDFFLGMDIRRDSQFFSPGATLTVTLVPEPMSLSLLALGLSLVAHRRRPHN